MNAFGFEAPVGVTANSKWVYSKAALSKVPEQVLLQIAAELELVVNGQSVVDLTPPRNWKDTKLFRLFISHVSKDKDKAKRMKEALADFGILGFVAHEDIHPTLEWQVEIDRALRTMDAFLAMCTPGFSGSVWTQQEIGFAVCRGVKVISLDLGEVPTGFLAREQALPRLRRTAEQIAKEISLLLSQDKRTLDRLFAARTSSLPPMALSDDVPF